MSNPADPPTTARTGEGGLERADRNMIELLQELRVAQTGVQILFGFLLSMSFTERFQHIDDVQRWIYLLVLLLSVIATGLLVAPAAAHRVTFAHNRKAATVAFGQRMFRAGLVALAATLAGSVQLVLDIAVGRVFGVAGAVVAATFLIVVWLVLPRRLLARRG